MSLALLARSAHRLREITASDPLKYFTPTKPQLELLKSEASITLFRAGNQIGKTAAGAAELLYYVLSCHPYKDIPSGPKEAWVVVHSWEQSKVVQAKIFELIPPATLADDCEFIAGRGFRGKTPIIRFKNGSLVRIKTTNQGSLGVASGTIDFCWIDEPPPAVLFGELAARLLRKRGRMVITMTPIGQDCTYLRQMCEAKKIHDIQASLSLENVTPLGCRPLLNQSDIDRIADTYLPLDRQARLEGSWEAGRPDGLVFEAFSEDMITDAPCPPDADYRFSIGIDHGSLPNAQAVILTAIDMTDHQDPHVYVLDEYYSGGAANEKSAATEHAKAILRMLDRNYLTHDMIHRWTGDIAHRGGRHGGRMSNAMLRSALEHELDYPQGSAPFRLHTAFKPRWSVYFGCQILHDRMVRGRLTVHPRCETLIRSFRRWTLKRSGGMDAKSDHKHAIDALRYAVVPIVDIKYQAPRHGNIRIR
jgi:phage terminase large subunit-like protein